MLGLLKEVVLVAISHHRAVWELELYYLSCKKSTVMGMLLVDGKKLQYSGTFHWKPSPKVAISSGRVKFMDKIDRLDCMSSKM